MDSVVVGPLACGWGTQPLILKSMTPKLPPMLTGGYEHSGEVFILRGCRYTCGTY